MDLRRYLAAALVLAVAACTGSSSPAPSPAPATMTPPAATTTAAPATSAPSPPPGTPAPASISPAAGCPGAPSPTGTQCHVITIRNSAFSPATLTVAINAQVVFVNQDAVPHSIVWADGTPTSPVLGQGDSTSREFIGQAPGTLDYTCGIHGPSMAGKIVFDASMPLP